MNLVLKSNGKSLCLLWRKQSDGEEILHLCWSLVLIYRASSISRFNKNFSLH